MRKKEVIWGRVGVWVVCRVSEVLRAFCTRLDGFSR
jgi:hypothetical protein